ncbi:MAG TPA: radical SAM protein [Phycisphaerales bacterium]|nr:radical SAM protein [Phycisphaerales bacterium]HMP37995.1 radical SAM protein [Phycisphaerales bacterium]
MLPSALAAAVRSSQPPAPSRRTSAGRASAGPVPAGIGPDSSDRTGSAAACARIELPTLRSWPSGPHAEAAIEGEASGHDPDAARVTEAAAAESDGERDLGTLRINEVFHSIQGESTRAGEPCIFIRLAGCHLRCTYCDTEYAFREGSTRAIGDLVAEVAAIECPLVEITGGEPLLQPRVHRLITRLCDLGRTVLIETSGACDIAPLDRRAIAILDVKTPGSGELHRMLWSNLERLRPWDEVKFVIADRADYDFARDVARRYALAERCAAVLFSPVVRQDAGLEIAGCPGLPLRTLAEWILADRLPVRLQVQLHKWIWDPGTRGV